MKFNAQERQILKDLLLSSYGLDIYTFWRRYKIAPSDLYKFTEKLIKMDIAELDDEKFILTKNGREFLISKRFEWITKSEKLWRKVPENFKLDQLPVNKPFAPSLSLMDNSLIPKQWRS